MKCTTRHSYRTKISDDEKRIEIGFIKLFKVNFRQPTSMKTILIERENGFGVNQPTRMDDIGLGLGLGLCLCLGLGLGLQCYTRISDMLSVMHVRISC